MIYIVIIQYGLGQANNIMQLIDHLNSKFNNSLEVEVVRTDLKYDSKYVKNVNECMEFSGYQEGLLRCISHAQMVGQVNDIQIIFLNDTFFSGHSKIFSNFILRNLIHFHSSHLRNSCFGILDACPDFFMGNTKKNPYFSSWIFSIKTNVEILKKIKFYENSDFGEQFYSIVWPNISKEYKQHVNQWLNPTSLFKGWYKSVPGVLLSDGEMTRKQVAIYNEHMLSRRFLDLDISVLDVSNISDNWRGILLNFYGLLDRFYINYLKLSYRLSYFGRRLKSSLV